MYWYAAFGLCIRSDLELPELISRACGTPDITIRLSPVNPDPLLDPVENCVYATERDVCLQWDQVGAFQVLDGREILVQPDPNAEDRLVRWVLLGAVVAVLLHQRGLFVLHASAVAVEGEAAVFIGAKGQGKSTTAAMLCDRGHQLLSDDVVALMPNVSGVPVLLPGYPELKLWPDAVASILRRDPLELPRAAALTDKRQWRLDEQFSLEPTPVRAFFALDSGDELCIDPVQRGTSMLELIAHSYVARFGQRVLQGPSAAAHLRACLELSRHVPMFTIRRPDGLRLAPRLAEIVERHMTAGVADER
jgi:hypothetical protein